MKNTELPALEPMRGRMHPGDDSDDPMPEELGEETEEPTQRMVSGDMLGFVPAGNRCSECSHNQDGVCDWMDEAVDPDDGCLRGFEST